MRKTVLLAMLATIALIWAFSIPVMRYFFPWPEDAGAFGDMFGAVNALFSGLAFAGVIYALILQERDSRISDAQFKKNMELSGLSGQIMAYSALLQECDAALQRYERWENTSNAGDYRSVKERVRASARGYRGELEKLAEKIAQYG
ncbi:hypothetical protein [Isoalcanivorax beigongshangi]|uniref:Uncharacterized protein n=1 Tax=Isoalcanivorax beigongshangi TaxID=3238810 RepID=A0ABV4ACX5_9GAMM